MSSRALAALAVMAGCATAPPVNRWPDWRRRCETILARATDRAIARDATFPHLVPRNPERAWGWAFGGRAMELTFIKTQERRIVPWTKNECSSEDPQMGWARCEGRANGGVIVMVMYNRLLDVDYRAMIRPAIDRCFR